MWKPHATPGRCRRSFPLLPYDPGRLPAGAGAGLDLNVHTRLRLAGEALITRVRPRPAWASG